MAQSAARQQRRGTAPTPASTPNGDNPFTFDADAKTRERREADVTIGEKVFHRRLKDNNVSIKARDLAREQNALNRRAIAKREEVEALPDSDVDNWERLEAEAAALDDAALAKVYEVVSCLLEGADGESPTPDFIQANVDVEVVGELCGRLTGGAEPLEGPTPETGSSD